MSDITNQLSENRLLNLEKHTRCLLIGVYKSNKEKEICLDHLKELKNLATTFGLETIDQISAPIREIDTATYLKSGKLEEIKKISEEKNIEVIIFDFDISPHQQRNIEKILKNNVIDRTELILGVFLIHAKSKEAKLQVKLAQFRYEMPRLKRMWTHLSRQRVGGKSSGYLKGAGEKQIEIDRQLLKKKIHDLQKEIDQIKKQRETQRKKRLKTNVPSFAIVGYTNAGKSTLMNALCDAKVLVEDKLFATLDTTTRQYLLPNNQKVVLIDTVGFIRKLPHFLIAAFKSTLEEALYSDILLHLVDVSAKDAKENAETSLEVLKELNADQKPIITCLNKIDKCSDPSIVNYFKIKYSKVIEISALKKQGFDDLMDIMIKEIAALRKIVKLKIPQDYYKLVSLVIQEGRVISTEYEENNILIEAEVPNSFYHKIEMFEI